MEQRTRGAGPELRVPPHWRMYENLDRVRLGQGRWLDVLGWGPEETPSRAVLRRPGLTLKAYGPATRGRPVLLIVPAPIKRSYIWDLSPGRSVVRACLARGVAPYMIQWEAPEPEAGLADFGDRYISECVAAIEAECGNLRPVLAGHSLGGVLAAVFAALNPDRAGGLALLGTPLHFAHSREQGELGMAAGKAGAEGFLDSLPDPVPGSLLSLAGFMASPGAFGRERWADWWKSLRDPEDLRTHMQVERWTLDELPLASRLVEEVLRQLYGADAFMAGTLRCGGRTAAAAAMEAPLLAVAEPRCTLVPPASVLPFVDRASSREKRVLRYDGDVGVAIQHVGALVGRNAHAVLWPAILEWVASRGRPGKLG